MGDYFAGEEVKFFLCLAWGVALRASHFLLLRQKKVSKEKATPGSVPGYARFLALLGRPGGLLNSPAAQTTQADVPRPACVAQHLSRGPVTHPWPSSGFHFLAFFRVDRNSLFFCSPVVPHRLSGPHVARRATQVLAEKGRGLSEGRSPEFRSTRQYRVAQGSRRSRPHNLGSPSFWLLFLGEARKSTPAPQARNPLPIAKRK